MKKYLFILSACLSLAFTQSSAQSKTGYHILHTYFMKSAGGWDYLALSPVNDWIYISHGTRVIILNKKNGDSVGVIENTTGVHGIAFDKARNKGYTSNGKLNAVTVFDLNNNQVISQIATDQNPDAILFEPYSKKIISCNGRSKNLDIIDPVQNKVVDSIDLGGKPESAVSDGKGKLYVNIEDKNEIVVVDTKKNMVMAHWNIAPGESPTGLALDNKNHRLFAGCENFLMIVDADQGRIIDSIKIGKGCDGVVFDKHSHNIFTANGEGNISVIHEDNANQFSLIETIPTKKGARTIALDETTGLLYLPTAEFEPAEPNQKGRPKMKEGTFQLLVVGK